MAKRKFGSIVVVLFLANLQWTSASPVLREQTTVRIVVFVILRNLSEPFNILVHVCYFVRFWKFVLLNKTIKFFELLFAPSSDTIALNSC